VFVSSINCKNNVGIVIKRTEMSFLNIKFPHNFEYSSDSDTIPLEFYLEAFPRSKIIYLKLGYFSSTAIKVLSYGFAQFIHNGGTIKIITNHFLYKNDSELLEKQHDADDKISERLLKDLKWLNDSLSSETQHFCDCLKLLVKLDRLELIPVMLLPNRMVHYKQGIFIDEEEHVIFMDGSCNFTANGLLENGENISIYRSWGSNFEKNKISSKEKNIDGICSRSNDKYRYLVKENILDAVVSIGKEKNITELLKEELELIKQTDSRSKLQQVLSYYEKKLAKIIKEEDTKPRFPFYSEPRPYQIQAYKNWIDSDKQGVFAMATGTGKTITSLNCLLNEYNDQGFYQAIILVPSKVLLNQWGEEASLFNFKNIYLVSSEYKWKPSITQLNTHLMFNKKHSFILIVTYSTFSTGSFQKQINNLPNDTLLIADEAHNIGSASMKELLPSLVFNKRIALSATPKRKYDAEGNTLIEKFFNSTEPYTFSYSMEKAIENGILCQYEYFPHIVSLTEDEMERYVEITKKLIMFFDSDSKKFKKSDIVEKLLLARKRIIHKAFNKKQAFIKIIKKQIENAGNLKFSFVYAPEGSDADGDNILGTYLDALEQVSPQTRAFSYTSESQNKKEVMRNFEEGYIDMLFSMKCLDEGVDVPRAELAIFCSSTGNPRQFIQRRGRVLRKHPDKDKAIIHDLIVIPKQDKDKTTFNIEKNLIREELVRVIHFASLAQNYYSAMEVCSPIAELYDLDMYALENELGDH
jgi:superfamily II DNA or RNA helicase